MRLLTLFTIAAQTQGPVYHGRDGALEVAAIRAAIGVTIDGRLDERVWHEAALLTGFSAYQPVDGRPSADSTDVLVWYAADAVYFGIRAYEPHGDVVRATLADRDAIDQDDRVEILLDTFDDRRRAFLFAVNPFGVQQDGVRSEGQMGAAGGPGAGFRFDGFVDLNPDYVYQSHGRLTSFGYEVEVRIPFASLRYQSAEPQTWGLQVVRHSQHNGYEATWTPAVRASASFLAQSGRLAGLSDLSRGLVLDATPEFTTRVDGAPTADSYGYDATPEIGGTLRWGATSNLNLLATANPDFSQVEADVGQVTVNERFTLFFPEKRPFFLEGLEQFDTPNRLIYTRRVADPIAGVKLTGKAGRWNIGLLSAADAQDFSVEDATPLVNLLRLRRDIGEGSTAGLAYTDRVDGSHYNRVASVDTRVLWRDIWFSELQVAGSWSRDATAVTNGVLWQAVPFDRTGRTYGNHAEILGISDDFTAASGFVPRTGIVDGMLANRLRWYGAPGARLEELTAFLSIGGTWSYDDFFDLRGTVEGEVSLTPIATLRGGWSVSASVDVRHQRFESEQYASYRVVHGADTLPFGVPKGLYGLWGGEARVSTPTRAVTISATVGYGAVPIFAEPTEGRQLDASLELNWRPTPALRLEGRWVHQRIDRERDGTRFSVANIPRLKLEYQLSRAVFVRYVGQFVAQDRDALRDPATEQPLAYGDDTEARFGPASGVSTGDLRSDLLFAYRPGPGTVAYLGYGASHEETDASGGHELTRTADGIFLKLSYLFRF